MIVRYRKILPAAWKLAEQFSFLGNLNKGSPLTEISHNRDLLSVFLQDRESIALCGDFPQGSLTHNQLLLVA